MDIQRKAFEESNNVNPDWSFKFDEELQQYVAVDFEMTNQVDEFNEHWDTFRAGWDAKAQAVPEWISVNSRLPECMHECTASGLEISDTVLVSNSKDNPSIGFGHLREDGNWVVYEGEHDFMNPQKVTHWMLMLKGASQ